MSLAGITTTTLVDPYIGASDATSRLATIAAGQVLHRGAVLGVVGATGEFMFAAAAATNGSDQAVAILAEGIDTRAGAAGGMIFESGRSIAAALTYGDGHTPATVRASLRDLGIYLETSTST